MFIMAFGQGNKTTQNIIEIIYLIDMITTFFVEYIPEQEGVPKIKDHYNIAKRYLNNNFIREAIPLFPLHYIEIGELSNLWYVVKLIRIIRGFELLNVHRIMLNVKRFYKDYTL